MYIIGLSEGSWISIGLGVLALLTPVMGMFLRAKQKADNADTMKTVDEKIIEDLKPVIKKIDDHEQDFKDFKKQEIEPLKADMNSLKCKTGIMDTKIDNVLSGIDDIKKMFEKSDKTFDNLWKELGKKQEKK